MNRLRKLETSYLLSPKIIYLIINLQFYGFHQLRSAFAREKFNISDNEYGKFTGYTQFITFFTSVFIGSISDRSRQYKRILLFLIVASTVVFVNFYISSLMKIHSIMFWAFMLLYLMLNNPKQPLTDKIMIEYLEDTASGSKVYGRQRLWGTISLSLATFVCEWCTLKSDGSFNFDNLIHYNVIATIMAILVVVFLVNARSERFYSAQQIKENIKAEDKSNINEDEKDNTKIEDKDNIKAEDKDNTKIEDKSNTKENEKDKANKVSSARNLSKSGAFIELLKNKEFIFFFFVIFSNAITRSALTIYLTIFHKEILKIKPYALPDNLPKITKMMISPFNNNPISTLTTFGIVFEMVIMFFSEGILTRFGFFWPLIFAQIVSLIRFLSYYFISPSNKHVYGLSCIFELFRGIYFGLIHISSVHIAPRLAPPHLKATSQMIYQGTFSALGSLISGYFFGDMFKSQLADLSVESRGVVYKKIFLINTFITLGTILVCLIKYGLKDRVLFSREAEEAKLSSYSNTDKIQ